MTTHGAKILPPDPDGQNADRAEWAAAALQHFQCTTGCDYEDSLGDLLCDLMHWADRNNFDFELAFDRAHGNYDAETQADVPSSPVISIEDAVKLPRVRDPMNDDDWAGNDEQIAALKQLVEDLRISPPITF